MVSVIVNTIDKMLVRMVDNMPKIYFMINGNKSETAIGKSIYNFFL